MPELALALWALYFAASLGIRALAHSRATGTSGLLLGRARPGSVKWLGETAQMLAIGLGVAAAALADTVEPIDALDGSGGHIAGLAIFALGFAGVVGSQHAMGASWRIGQDEEERTALVTSGPFRIIRNPIFSSLVLVQLGLALLVPSVLAGAGLVLLIPSILIQVRAVEEPHLIRTHGNEYLAYARRVGRFAPGLGRLGD